MEPTNHPVRKEHYLSNISKTSMITACSILISRASTGAYDGFNLIFRLRGDPQNGLITGAVGSSPVSFLRSRGTRRKACQPATVGVGAVDGRHIPNGHLVCTSARAFSHQWTDLTSTQWHTAFTDLTSVGQISPHPNGTPQESKSDLANYAIPMSTIPLRSAIPELKKHHASDVYPTAVPNGTLAKPTSEVRIWILSVRLRSVKGTLFWVGIRPKDVCIEDITNPIP